MGERGSVFREDSRYKPIAVFTFNSEHTWSNRPKKLAILTGRKDWKGINGLILGLANILLIHNLMDVPFKK